MKSNAVILGLILGLILVFVLSKFIVPNIRVTPVAHADTYVSDREQEREYCAAWATQKMPVVGGTEDAIRKHCQKYL